MVHISILLAFPLTVFADRAGVGALTRSEVEDDTTLFGYREGTAPEQAVSLTVPIRVDQYHSSWTIADF